MANQPAAAPGDILTGTATFSATTPGGSTTTLGIAPVAASSTATLGWLMLPLGGGLIITATYGGDACHDPLSASLTITATVPPPNLTAQPTTVAAMVPVAATGEPFASTWWWLRAGLILVTGSALVVRATRSRQRGEHGPRPLAGPCHGERDARPLHPASARLIGLVYHRAVRDRPDQPLPDTPADRIDLASVAEADQPEPPQHPCLRWCAILGSPGQRGSCDEGASMPTSEPTRTFEEAARWFVALTKHIEPHAWHQPALGVWDVQSLVGHTARALITTTRALGEPATTAELTQPVAYLRWSLSVNPQAIVDRAAATALALGADPVAAVARLADEAIAAVAQADLRTPVHTPAGAMPLAAYLPTRTLELVVHGADLAHVLALPEQPPPRALRSTVELLLELHLATTDPIQLIRSLAGRPSPTDAFALWPSAEAASSSRNSTPS